MSQWKKIAPFAALSLTMALTSTGCLAPSASDETTTDSEIAATDDAKVQQTSEQTGEADQACGGGGFGFGGFGGCGCIGPFGVGPIIGIPGLEITPFEDVRLRGFLHSGFPFNLPFASFGCGGCGGCF